MVPSNDIRTIGGAMYAKGVSMRDEDQLRDLYGVDLSPTMIRMITSCPYPTCYLALFPMLEQSPTAAQLYLIPPFR